MVERKTFKFLLPGYKVALLLGVKGNPPLESVPEEIDVVHEFVKKQNFQEVVILRDEEVTKDQLELFWAKHTHQCIEHRI